METVNGAGEERHTSDLFPPLRRCQTFPASGKEQAQATGSRQLNRIPFGSPTPRERPHSGRRVGRCHTLHPAYSLPPAASFRPSELGIAGGSMLDVGPLPPSHPFRADGAAMGAQCCNSKSASVGEAAVPGLSVQPFDAIFIRFVCLAADYPPPPSAGPRASVSLPVRRLRSLISILLPSHARCRAARKRICSCETQH